MKACLLYTPFSSLSYIPLGIAYLKGFLESRLPEVSVKNMDLSNNLHHNLEKKEYLSCLSRLCSLCPHCDKPACRKALFFEELSLLAKSISFFKGPFVDGEKDEFHDIRTYNAFKRMYDTFYQGFVTCSNQVLSRAIELDTAPAYAILEKSIFQDDIRKIALENPGVVGFSVFSDAQLFYSLALAKIIKKRINPKIVFGGACIAHLEKKKLLQLFGYIDFVIYKEGELGLLQLLRGMYKKRYNDVPNLVYRKEGAIIENQEAVVEELDQLSFPDYSGFCMDRYFSPLPVVSTSFSRGCPWGKCTFCAHHKTYASAYRKRSISNLVDELAAYQQQGIRHIWFVDEMIPSASLAALSKMLLERRIKIYYGLFASPRERLSCSLLRMMFKSGCRIIAWGVESASQRILNLMNKGTDSKMMEGLLRASAEAEIANIALMIEGFPTQGRADVIADMRFLEKNSRYIYSVGIHQFWLETGTPIFHSPGRFGLTSLKKCALLKTKKGRLFDSDILFARKQEPPWDLLSELMGGKKRWYRGTNRFDDTGVFDLKEHMLLHVARN